MTLAAHRNREICRLHFVEQARDDGTTGAAATQDENVRFGKVGANLAQRLNGSDAVGVATEERCCRCRDRG